MKSLSRFQGQLLAVIATFFVIAVLLAIAMSNRIVSHRDATPLAPPGASINVEGALAVTYQFDIGEAPLPEQLTELFNLHPVIYVYAYENLQLIKGHPIRGRFALGVALQQMLDSTGCSYEILKEFLLIQCGPALNLSSSNKYTGSNFDPSGKAN